MATSRCYVCEECHSTTWIYGLFDALLQKANADFPKRCDKCSHPNPNIHLTFNFGLDIGPAPFKLLAAFLPDSISSWEYGEDGKDVVEFYPFMIFLESINEGSQSIWLPYWHLIKGPDGAIKAKKYGQWAPFVNIGAYKDLTSKARAAGYL